MQKTTFLHNNDNLIKDKKWYTIDATNLILGDLAVFAANILRGKNKAYYTPNVDSGDYLIITNANKVLLTGKKITNKKYYDHSGYIGGLRVRTAKTMIEKYPSEMLERAIKGMLPKTKLATKIAKKLFVYKDLGKNHSAQNPITITLKGKIK